MIARLFSNPNRSEVEPSKGRNPVGLVLLIVVAVFLVHNFDMVDSADPFAPKSHGDSGPTPIPPAHMLVPTVQPVAYELAEPHLNCDHAQWEMHGGQPVASYLMGGFTVGEANSQWYASTEEMNAWNGLRLDEQQRWLIVVCGKAKP